MELTKEQRAAIREAGTHAGPLDHPPKGAVCEITGTPLDENNAWRIYNGIMPSLLVCEAALLAANFHYA